MTTNDDLFKDFDMPENPENPNNNLDYQDNSLENTLIDELSINDLLDNDDDDVTILQDFVGKQEPAKPAPDNTPSEEDDFVKKYNEEFGTNFKDKVELKQSLQNQTPAKVSALTEDQEKEYERNTATINALSDVLNKSSREILTMHHLSLKKQEMGEHFDIDIAKDEVKDKLDKWEDNGTLDFNANNLKSEIKSELQKLQDKNKGLEEIRDSEKIAEAEKKVGAIQNKIIDIFKKQSFFGIKPEKDVLNKVYADIVNNEFSKQLNQNPELLVELAIMHAYKSEIEKRALRPTADQGRKEVLDELIPNHQKSTTLNQARGGSTTKKLGGDELVDLFLFGNTAKQ
jgi:hypothetical protein